MIAIKISAAAAVIGGQPKTEQRQRLQLKARKRQRLAMRRPHLPNIQSVPNIKDGATTATGALRKAAMAASPISVAVAVVQAGPVMANQATANPLTVGPAKGGPVAAQIVARAVVTARVTVAARIAEIAASVTISAVSQR